MLLDRIQSCGSTERDTGASGHRPSLLAGGKETSRNKITSGRPTSIPPKVLDHKAGFKENIHFPVKPSKV